MQHMKSDYFEKIEKFIDYYFFQNGTSPTNIEIARGTRLPTATVSRYISKMCENGVLISNGHRNIKTKKINNHINNYIEISVWDDIPDDLSNLFLCRSSKSILVSKNLVGEKELCIILNLINSWTDFDAEKGDYLIVEKGVGLTKIV